MIKGNPVKLRTTNPVIYFTLWAMVATNVLYGAGLFNFHPIIPYPVIQNLFDFHIWGWLFIIFGISGATSLITNNYGFIRRNIFFGLFFKSFWFVALVLRSLSQGATLTITSVWLFIVVSQVIIAIYFPEK